MTLCALWTLALLAYTYFGYPVVIGLLARLRPGGSAARTARAADDAAPREVSVSAFLPVFNGAALLRAKITSLLEQDYPPALLDVLVYCDGCTDDTEATARALAAEPRAAGRIRVVASAERRGKPAAINALRALAGGELLLLNDARQPLSRGSVRALARALGDPQVGCATGNLVLAGGAPSGVYWKYEHWIRRQESRFRGVVGMTGAIAMMRRAELDPLPEDLILDDVWIPARLGLRGERVALVADAEAYDTAFEDEQEFRRKVRTLAGNYQLFALVPALLSPFANPFWFELVSHKVLRLVAPWLMLVLAATSTAAAVAGGGFRGLPAALVVAQAAFYGAAAAGRRAGRLAGVARTFVVLNLAAVVGLVKYVSGRQRVTW
ncbi:MAG TPA: glycosyltransferase [Polyangia bacterium]|nr:glycosyltransferase [Polyangia bacterium]